MITFIFYHTIWDRYLKEYEHDFDKVITDGTFIKASAAYRRRDGTLMIPTKLMQMAYQIYDHDAVKFIKDRTFGKGLVEVNDVKSRAFAIYDYINARGANNTKLHEGKIIYANEDMDNDYNKNELPHVPKGTVMKIDFGCDNGLYALADVNGVLHKVKIKLCDLHKIHFPEIDGQYKA